MRSKKLHFKNKKYYIKVEENLSKEKDDSLI